MAKKTNTYQKQKEKEDTPFMQVNYQSDPFSNFIANFKRQYNKAKGELKWKKIFRRKHNIQQKQSPEPDNIIGPSKTIIHVDFKTHDFHKISKAEKKTALKVNQVAKTQPDRLKPRLKL
ncbi:hypothetical protein CMT37_12780 [Elizabethkingia anophelis]|nr:hypothetical protein [Elizabethkingia anophelis]